MRPSRVRDQRRYHPRDSGIDCFDVAVSKQKSKAWIAWFSLPNLHI